MPFSVFVWLISERIGLLRAPTVSPPKRPLRAPLDAAKTINGPGVARHSKLIKQPRNTPSSGEAKVDNVCAAEGAAILKRHLFRVRQQEKINLLLVLLVQREKY